MSTKYKTRVVLQRRDAHRQTRVSGASDANLAAAVV